MDVRAMKRAAKLSEWSERIRGVPVEWEAGKDLARREREQHQELLPVGAAVHSRSGSANAASGGTGIRSGSTGTNRAGEAL